MNNGHIRLRGFWSEVQRVYENRIWTSLPSSLRIAWNGVLKPRHFLGVRLAVMTMSCSWGPPAPKPRSASSHLKCGWLFYNGRKSLLRSTGLFDPVLHVRY